jgi:hypothetical protein
MERSRHPPGSPPRQEQEARCEAFLRAPWTEQPDAADIALLKSAVQSEGSQSARGSTSAPSVTRRLSRLLRPQQLFIPARTSPLVTNNRRCGGDDAGDIADSPAPAGNSEGVAATSASHGTKTAPPQPQQPQPQVQPQPRPCFLKQPAAAAAAVGRLSLAARPTRPGPQILCGFRSPWLREPLLDVVDTGAAATEGSGASTGEVRRKPRGVADVLAMVALSLGPTASQSVPAKTRRLDSQSASTAGHVPPPSPRSGPASPRGAAVSPKPLPLPPLGHSPRAPPAALQSLSPSPVPPKYR